MHSERCHPERSDVELQHAIIALADECRAPTIATDARRSRPYATRRTLNLCLRLRHHLFELQRALGKTRPQNMARMKAIEIARAVAEQQLDRAAHAADPARVLIATRLAVARKKFVMATKADALAEHSLRTANVRRRWLRPAVDLQAHEIANHHLAAFWTRTVGEVHGPVSAFAQALCADVDASLADLGEVLLRDALVDVTQPPLGTFLDEMSTRIGASRAQLDGLLETGAHAITQRLLDYYDHAMVATDARFRERLDSISMTVLHAITFADSAQRAGDAGVSSARMRIAQWSQTLEILVDDLS
jgi:hypothetical protein